MANRARGTPRKFTTLSPARRIRNRQRTVVLCAAAIVQHLSDGTEPPPQSHPVPLVACRSVAPAPDVPANPRLLITAFPLILVLGSCVAGRRVVVLMCVSTAGLIGAGRLTIVRYVLPP